MIRFGTKVQLLVFALITALGIAYVGANYIGVHPFNGPYTVYVKLPATGGIFSNADVADRGVVIGKVGAVTIDKDRTGVIAALKINHGKKIPTTGLTATVADLSAVGEPYIELAPAAASAPYLKPGETIAAEGQIPVDDAAILLNLKRLLASVNTKDLSTVIDELGKGFADLGPTLKTLITNSDALTQSAINALPATLSLIDNGKTVLDTQNDVAAELKSFAASFSDVTGEISGKDPALRGVLDNGVLASKQLATLLQANEPVLPTLLNNLNTFTGIQDVRLPQTRAVLELFPAIVGDSFYALPAAAPGQQETARFGLVTDLGSFCSTGYSSTVKRSNQSADWGGAANLDSYCHGDNTTLDASGLDVRGARNDPKPAGDNANVSNSDPYPGPHYGQGFPGSGKVGACGTPSCPSGSGSSKTARSKSAGAKHSKSKSSGVKQAGTTPATVPAGSDSVIPEPYNPKTGLVEGLNGKLYQLGLNGPVAPVFGSDSYTWLLIAPTMR
jgi:phospholipid/cholesterol/gamma-HCH transport system substrate-binding protein